MRVNLEFSGMRQLDKLYGKTVQETVVKSSVFAICKPTLAADLVDFLYCTVLYCKIELKQIQQQEKGPGCESAVVFHRTVIPTSVPNYCD